jgi:hypothetical protein
MSQAKPMIHALLDVCRFVLEDQGETQGGYLVAEQRAETILNLCEEHLEDGR